MLVLLRIETSLELDNVFHTLDSRAKYAGIHTWLDGPWAVQGISRILPLRGSWPSKSIGTASAACTGSLSIACT